MFCQFRAVSCHAVEVRAVTQQDGRNAGVLQAAAGTADAIDATVVLLAAPGDRILTGDPAGLNPPGGSSRKPARHRRVLIIAAHELPAADADGHPEGAAA
jgi:hypothetical protein